jgi:hypothetical protein
MKRANRNMSINKWKRVLALFDAGKYEKARDLAISTGKCGHCREYEHECKNCTLGTRHTYNHWNCRADVCYVVNNILNMIVELDTRRDTMRARARMRNHILKVQRLVRTK